VDQVTECFVKRVSRQRLYIVNERNLRDTHDSCKKFRDSVYNYNSGSSFGVFVCGVCDVLFVIYPVIPR